MSQSDFKLNFAKSLLKIIKKQNTSILSASSAQKDERMKTYTTVFKNDYMAISEGLRVLKI